MTEFLEGCGRGPAVNSVAQSVGLELYHQKYVMIHIQLGRCFVLIDGLYVVNPNVHTL